MAKRYHINPETKEVGVCSAEIRCKFAENGEEPKHYTDPIKAHKDAEDMLENEYGAFSTMSQQDERPISVGTHASHCCETHGCKYSADNCPVARGQIKGVKACEYCDMDEEDRIPPEDFQRDFPAGERLSEYVNNGDAILYKDEVIEIDNFRYNSAMLAYEIETLNGETVFIPDSDWYEESKIKLFGQNEVMKDPEEFQRTYEAGEPLSSQIAIGDQFSYNGEVYKMKDYEYNRPLLQYEIKTNKGDITISDDDWYWSGNKIKLLGKDEVMRDPEDFQKDYVAGEPLSSQIKIGDQFSYYGEVYKMKDYEYNRPLLQYEIKTNKGDITISDDDWYWSGNKIKLLEENDE